MKKKTKSVKILEKIMKIHKIIFFTHIRMDFITKETCKNNDIEVIIDENDILWLNEKHVEEKLNHRNLTVITRKYH